MNIAVLQVTPELLRELLHLPESTSVLAVKYDEAINTTVELLIEDAELLPEIGRVMEYPRVKYVLSSQRVEVTEFVEYIEGENQ